MMLLSREALARRANSESKRQPGTFNGCTKWYDFSLLYDESSFGFQAFVERSPRFLPIIKHAAQSFNHAHIHDTRVFESANLAPGSTN
jgi:hypothetical protein